MSLAQPGISASECVMYSQSPLNPLCAEPQQNPRPLSDGSSAKCDMTNEENLTSTVCDLVLGPGCPWFCGPLMLLLRGSLWTSRNHLQRSCKPSHEALPWPSASGVGHQSTAAAAATDSRQHRDSLCCFSTTLLLTLLLRWILIYIGFSPPLYNKYYFYSITSLSLTISYNQLLLCRISWK